MDKLTKTNVDLQTYFDAMLHCIKIGNQEMAESFLKKIQETTNKHFAK